MTQAPRIALQHCKPAMHDMPFRYTTDTAPQDLCARAGEMGVFSWKSLENGWIKRQGISHIKTMGIVAILARVVVKIMPET